MLILMVFLDKTLPICITNDDVSIVKFVAYLMIYQSFSILKIPVSKL